MEHLHHAHAPRNDYGRFIATILLFCLLAAAGYALQHTISCFLLSWVIAYLLDPLLVHSERRGLKRLYALVLLYVILGILTVFFLTFIVPAITISWNAFILDLPTYIQKLKQVALDWKSRLPDHYGSDEIQWLIDKASSKIDTAAEKTGFWVYSFGTQIFFNLFNIVLAPILVFFMLYYKQTVIDTVVSWLPDGRQSQIVDIAHEVNSSIGGYLRGQVAGFHHSRAPLNNRAFCARNSSSDLLRRFCGRSLDPAVYRRNNSDYSGALLCLVQIPDGSHARTDDVCLRDDLLCRGICHQTAGIQGVDEPESSGDHYHGYGSR